MFTKATGPVSLITNRSQFVKNMLKLVLGSGIAQAITFLISPVLTRLYTPEDLGIFTFFISIVGLFTIIATLRYEIAIVFPKDDKDAVNIFSLSVIVAFGISLLLLGFVILYRLFFQAMLPLNPVLSAWLWLLPVLVFSLGLANVFQNWMVRKKQYRLLSAGRIINSAGNNMTALVFGFLGIGAWGLMIGNLTGTLVFILFLGYSIYRTGHLKTKDYHRSSVAEFARKYKDLPLSNSLQSVLEAMQNYGIIYLAKIFFSSLVVGFYALSIRVLQAPLWLIGSAISQVYTKDAAERYSKGESLDDLLVKTIKMAGMIALPVMIVLLVGGPWLFAIVFGHAWREAGVYARILAPWMFFDFIRYCIAQTPLIIGRTRTMLYISVAGNLIIVTALVVGRTVFNDVSISFMILSSSMSIYAIFVILWIRFIINRTKKSFYGNYR